MITPLYGQLSPLRVPTRAGRNLVSDPDAEAYLQAVESADTTGLEQSVADAVNSFIVGCKSDGIWSAIKASCILAGARTLSGALVPLAGTAPTNNNFVSADYNRKTGLVGNGTSKYLNTNRNNNADPQNNQHLSVYSTNASAGYFLASFVNSIGTSALYNVSNTLRAYSRSHVSSGTGFTPISNQGTTLGFKGITRNSSSAFSIRSGATTTSGNTNSASPDSNSIIILARSNGSGGATAFSLGRLSFYSIGESINLAALDTRVSNLMTDLSAAI